MFKIKWDKKNNGIIFSSKIKDKDKINSPRPVFHEELDLLGFNKYWVYPKSSQPLLWAIGRRYYYKGNLVAEANGGNIYEAPVLNIKYKGLFDPIDLDLILKNNNEVLKILESEAIDFIQETYKKYHEKLKFAVAFSGGKDSQVILDLVSRVIAPNNYQIIYTDTGMEIPFTEETIEYTISRYKKQYPEFNFHIARSENDILRLWNEFGTPSRIHRWCCSVTKTVPFAKKIKELFNSNEKYVTFEGVRAEESARRNKYSRVTTDSSKSKQINAEIILNWNATEVFLYLFSRNIKLNRGYRYGLTRVGCSICPFSSPWSEYIMQQIAPKTTNKFVNIIKSQAKIESDSDQIIQDYIKNGQWKMRSGGRNLKISNTKTVKKISNTKINYVIENPKTDLLEWLFILGETRHKIDNNKITGEINSEKSNIMFSITNSENKQNISFEFSGDKLLENRLNKIINKTTFCVGCSACEIECPMGAISFNPKFKLDKTKCIHCLKCLNFTDKGCLRAKSINITEGVNYMNENKIATSKYQTFGLRNSWLKSFLNKPENWFSENPAGLGNRQLQSMNSWLRDAEVLTSKKELTPFGKLILHLKNDETNLWLLIWVNLFYNVNLIKWYLTDIKWGDHFTTKELIELIISNGEVNKAKTTNNAISSLANMFAESPLGKEIGVGKITKKSNIRTIWKNKYNEIDILPFAYSLFKYAEDKERYKFTVSEFFDENCDGGPRTIFGIEKSKFEKLLRTLQEEKNHLLKVNLVAGLDNIFLREDIKSSEVLELLINK